MKKTILHLLCVVCLLGLTACWSSPAEEETKPEEEKTYEEIPADKIGDEELNLDNALKELDMIE